MTNSVQRRKIKTQGRRFYPRDRTSVNECTRLWTAQPWGFLNIVTSFVSCKSNFDIYAYVHLHILEFLAHH